MKKIILSSLLLIHFISHAQQQIVKANGKPLTPASIDQFIKKLMFEGEVTGLAVGIINNNRPVYVKTYGYKNKAKGQVNDTTASFYAASLAKPLFAFLVMQLVDEKKIDLDKPLYTYLPKPIPDYDIYKDLAGDERWKLITARHCLSHTTGFPNWREQNKNKLQLFFTPGERYSYSGEGLVLLQLIVETVTNQKLEQLAREKIFLPFGMKHTSFLWQPLFEKNYAVGHNNSEDTIPKTKSPRENAAGSMETTIADYTRFVAALMQGKGISAASKREMLSPQIKIHTAHQFPPLNNDTAGADKTNRLAYGLGWGLFRSPHGNAFFKEGHGDGWVHYMISFPERKNAVIIMTNSANGESIFTELVKDLTGVSIPGEWEGYSPYRKTVQLSMQEMRNIAGTYEGKIRAIISIVDGKLKVESPTVHLPKTNIYAVDDHHFFLKIMDTEMDFVKDASGKVVKIVLNDEGERYELKKSVF
jgi:CubicO group peptidase (beta-lactamase class C family)